MSVLISYLLTNVVYFRPILHSPSYSMSVGIDSCRWLGLDCNASRVLEWRVRLDKQRG